MATSLQDFFESLPARIDTGKLAGIHAVFQFVGTGEGGGAWYVRLVDGNPEIGEGHAAAVDLIATATVEDFLAIVNGKLRGELAFLTGRLKVEGDITLAYKLESLLRT